MTPLISFYPFGALLVDANQSESQTIDDGTLLCALPPSAVDAAPIVGRCGHFNQSAQVDSLLHEWHRHILTVLQARRGKIARPGGECTVAWSAVAVNEDKMVLHVGLMFVCRCLTAGKSAGGRMIVSFDGRV